MNAFFASPHNRNKLCLEAAKWIGTPFVAHGAVCGAGVDCVNLVGQLLIACGHERDFALPTYSMDGGKHNRTSQLTDYLDTHPRFAKPFEPVQPGDVLCFKLGRSSHHCAILIHGKTFVHALFGRKVSFGSLADGTFARSLNCFYRPLEVQS